MMMASALIWPARRCRRTAKAVRRKRGPFAPTTGQGGVGFHSTLAVDSKPFDEKREESSMTSLIAAGSGLICVAMLAIGFGFVVPVSSAVSALCDLLAVGSGVYFVGLLDGA